MCDRTVFRAANNQTGFFTVPPFRLDRAGIRPSLLHSYFTVKRYSNFERVTCDTQKL